MWKAHARAQAKKGLRALWSYNAFIGKSWGLSLKMTLCLYKRVIILKITYAVIAWWNIMDIAVTRSQLKRLQSPMHYDRRGNEKNSNKSAGYALGSANTQNGCRVCSTDGSIPPTEARVQSELRILLCYYLKRCSRTRKFMQLFSISKTPDHQPFSILNTLKLSI